MVLQREILYLTHLIGKYRARLGIFCSDLMEQKGRGEERKRQARETDIYSKPLLIIDRRHIESLFASKLDGFYVFERKERSPCYLFPLYIEIN